LIISFKHHYLSFPIIHKNTLKRIVSSGLSVPESLGEKGDSILLVGRFLIKELTFLLLLPDLPL
ncbi:hypothetical protein BpHYR1_033762, partial [Brachionus plicatilis]